MISDEEIAAETAERRDKASQLVGITRRRLRSVENQLRRLDTGYRPDSRLEYALLKAKRKLLLDMLHEAGISPWP